MLNINNLQKKTLKITIPIFLMMVFSFLFIPGVKADDGYEFHDINELELFDYEITEDYLYNTFNVDKNIYPYVFLATGYKSSTVPKDTTVYIKLYFFKDKPNLIANKFVLWDIPRWNFNFSDNVSALVPTAANISFKVGGKQDINSKISLKSVDNISGNFNIEGYFYYFSNYDVSYSDSDDSAIPSSKPQSYTFNEDIDVTNISKVKVKFNLPSDTKNLNLSLNYSITGMNDFGTIGQPYVALKSINEDGKEQIDISNTDHVDYDTLVASACVIVNCDQYKDWKTNPFEEMLNGINEDKVDYFLNNHVSDITKWDSFREITNKIINKHYNYANHYVDDYNMTLLPDSTVNGYSLEFDTFNYNGNLHLNFTSNLNYTIEYEYMSDNKDYFTTINMKDYAALIMIPKVYDRNNEIQSSISSDIYLSGKYDIEFWESMESKNVLYKKSDYDDIVFSHYHHRLYPNTILYFIKKPVDDSNMDLYIKFDNRYYSYVVKRTLSEEVVINNPNTGEDITIGDISDLYNYGLDNKSKFTFNSFLKPIKFVFESITNFYQNYCPELVQNFFYLIFVFFVVLVLIRIFL